MTLKIGDQAPKFNLPDENGKPHSLADYAGKPHSLADYAGKPVVLFFYPEDDTPGCTQEACNFRDDFAQYEAAGAVLLGVSPDDAGSHDKFKRKYQLPFTLLADEGHKVCDLYGVWGPKKLFGREYDGVIRTTFLIDGEGMIAEIFKVTRIAPHSENVLSALEAL